MPNLRCDARAQNAGLVPRERLRYLAGRLHTLGPRPLSEFLLELDAGAELHPALERYARLAPLAGFIRVMDGDRLPPARLVGGRRR
jgi:hypothetical protein